MPVATIARAIDASDDTWRLFLPFELVWAGGRIGRVAAQMYYWWFRSRERNKARQARNREAEHQRGETRYTAPVQELKDVNDETAQAAKPANGGSRFVDGVHGEQNADTAPAGLSDVVAHGNGSEEIAGLAPGIPTAPNSLISVPRDVP